MSSDKLTIKQRFDRWMIKHGRVLVIGIPYFWLFLFFLVPFLIVLKIS
ncbi:MAG TPA: putrescine ABC transporter permease PotH, partial [Thalassospira sp.]|nr:putrescine ABC transporter permease PotH [Thalassospira sp.]